MLDQVEQLVWQQRRALEAYLTEDPDFASSLEPYFIKRKDAPEAALFLARAANLAGVGPMAAVAGFFAEIVGNRILQTSSEVIVENGGDLFVKVVEPIIVGIYAGKSPLSEKIGLFVEPEQTPIGICSSSGTVGPSFSRGSADAAVALSPSTPLADAAATALGNLVQGVDDLEVAIEVARQMEGITGALLIFDDKLAVWGDISLRSTK